MVYRTIYYATIIHDDDMGMDKAQLKGYTTIIEKLVYN